MMVHVNYRLRSKKTENYVSTKKVPKIKTIKSTSS